MAVSWLYYKPNFTKFPLLLRILGIQPVLILLTMLILHHLTLIFDKHVYAGLILKKLKKNKIYVSVTNLVS